MNPVRAEIIAIGAPSLVKPGDEIEDCVLTLSQVLELEGLISRLIEQHAHSPRDLGITMATRRDTAEVRRWALKAGLITTARGPVPADAVALYDAFGRGSA